TTYTASTSGAVPSGSARMPPGLTRNTDSATATARPTERCAPGQAATSTRPQVKYQGQAAGPPAAATNKNAPSSGTRVAIRVRYSRTSPAPAVSAAAATPKADSSVR